MSAYELTPLNVAIMKEPGVTGHGRRLLRKD
jgi:hypothetical protein